MGNRFDQLAHGWDNNPARITLTSKVIEELNRYVDLNKNMKVLDYGSGTGLILLGIQPFVKEITGMDSSAGMLHVLKEKIARQGLTNVSVKQHNIETDDLPLNYFDLVITSMTLHHIRNSELFFTKAHHSLKKSGQLAIIDLVTEDGTFHGDASEGIYHYGFDPAEIEKNLNKIGFLTNKANTFHSMERIKDDGIKYYPLFFIFAQKI